MLRKYKFFFLLVVIPVLFWISVKKFQNIPFLNAYPRFFSFMVLGLMVFCQIIYRFPLTNFSQKNLAILAWVTGIVFALWSSYLFYSVSFDIVQFFLSFFPLVDPSKRVLLQNSLESVALLAASSGTLIGTSEVLHGPVVKKIFLPCPELKGLKICQISDLHVGGTIKKRYVQNVVHLVNGQEPHLIVLTGDIADGLPANLQEDLAPLKYLASEYGNFYVTGNHEYYWGVEAWLQQMHVLGFTPLMNANKVIKYQNAKLLLAGVPDPQGKDFFPSHDMKFEAASNCSVPVDYRILLCHRPSVYQQAWDAKFNLLLSGHTHAGQFFPFSVVIGFFHKYYEGLNQYKDLSIYVNSGTGYWGPTSRFLVRSEITLFEFV